MTWEPMPHQIPPPDDKWRGWLIVGDRGSGRTDALIAWMNAHAYGLRCFDGEEPHRMGIFAPEDSTVRRLLAFNPEIESGYNSTARYRWIKWPDGSTAQLFETGKGTSDRLRGSMARCCDIYDDLDGWNDRKILMSQAVFGLRAGPARWAGAVTRAARFDDRIAVTEVGADVNTNLIAALIEDGPEYRTLARRLRNRKLGRPDD